MKITVWTLTTDGDNCELDTSVHATEKAAYDELRSYLMHDADFDADATDAELSDAWADLREGSAIIARHVVVLP